MHHFQRVVSSLQWDGRRDFDSFGSRLLNIQVLSLSTLYQYCRNDAVSASVFISVPRCLLDHFHRESMGNHWNWAFELFQWNFCKFHIVCDRYTSDYVHFTFSDTIWPLLLQPNFGTQMITLAETALYNLFNYIHSICDHYSWSSSAIILFDEDIFIVFPQLDGQQVTAGWFGQGGGLTHLVVIIILMKIFPKGTGHGYHWSILFTFTLIICWLMKKQGLWCFFCARCAARVTWCRYRSQKWQGQSFKLSSKSLPGVASEWK